MKNKITIYLRTFEDGTVEPVNQDYADHVLVVDIEKHCKGASLSIKPHSAEVDNG